MLTISIPGRSDIRLEHLLLDYNGTLALDGALLPGVAPRLRLLARHLTVHVLTADTFGTAGAQLDGLPVQLGVIPEGAQAQAKYEYMQSLGDDWCAAIGNGANDVRMLDRAGLGICVAGPEGAAGRAVAAAQVVVPDINIALDLLLHPKRLAATLRE